MQTSLPPKWRRVPLAPEMHTMQPCIEGLNRTQAARVPISEYVPQPGPIAGIIKQTWVECPIAVSERKVRGSDSPGNISRRPRVAGPALPPSHRGTSQRRA